MLDIARRWGPYFLGAFAILLGLILQALIFLNEKSYQFILIIVFAVFALICLTMTVIALTYDIKDVRKKDYERKHRYWDIW